jgi:prophage regulatory protein
MNASSEKPPRRSRARTANALPVQPLLVDRGTAAAMLGISESMLEELVRQEQAPKPRQLGARRVGWLVRELVELAEALPVSSVLPPANTGRNAEPKTRRTTP